MIWPFRPRCPLDVHNKVWTEGWLARLAADFGVDRLLIGNDVFDVPARFLAEHDANEADTRTILSSICDRMRFDPDRFSLSPESSEEQIMTAPRADWEVDDDGRYVVRTRDVEAGGLEFEVAILARLVGCTLLIERGSFNPRELNDWWRAELTAAVMGFGPMIANMTLARIQEVPSRVMLRYGYLPSHISAYALSVLCWLGGDNEPGYGSMLRRDAADSYRKGLQYLHQTGDCLVQRNDWGRPIEDRDLSVLISELSSRSESRRLAAIWDLMAGPVDAARAVDAVAERLHDNNPTIRRFAAAALDKWGADARMAIPDLLHTVESEKDSKVCAVSAHALGVICEAAGVTAEQRDKSLDELTHLRERTRDVRVRDAVDEAMSRLGADPAVIGPNLAKAIRDAIAAVADARLRRLLDCVRRVEPDVERFLQEHFSDRDPELLATARAALREPQTPDPYAGLPDWTGGSIMTKWRWM